MPTDLNVLAAATLSRLAHGPRDRVCARCGKPYVARTANSSYCWRRCRYEAMYARVKAQRHAAKAQNGDAPRAG